MQDPTKIPRLHSALKALYGSFCKRNLNCLSALLQKHAITTSGLQFLLKCRQYHVFPVFITRAINFSQLGRHLERIAEKLPARMLRAAIRDLRARLAGQQSDINDVWSDLFEQITDQVLWNALVDQKDAFYGYHRCKATKRLQAKFIGLFARGLPNDPYCGAFRPLPRSPISELPDHSADPCASSLRSGSDQFSPEEDTVSAASVCRPEQCIFEDSYTSSDIPDSAHFDRTLN